MRKISTSEVLAIIEPFIGMTVHRVRRGHGSAIFLEISEKESHSVELTVMIEWSWRVERSSEIWFGSWSDEDFFTESLKKLVGLELKSISFLQRLPEVVMELGEDTWICSFSTVEGDPEWALLTSGAVVSSSKGELIWSRRQLTSH